MMYAVNYNLYISTQTGAYLQFIPTLKASPRSNRRSFSTCGSRASATALWSSVPYNTFNHFGRPLGRRDVVFLAALLGCSSPTAASWSSTPKAYSKPSCSIGRHPLADHQPFKPKVSQKRRQEFLSAFFFAPNSHPCRVSSKKASITSKNAILTIGEFSAKFNLISHTQH